MKSIRRLAVVLCLAVGSLLVIVPSANAGSFTFSDGVSPVFSATYDCNARTVTVFSDDAVEYGTPFNTWYKAWVYDFTAQQWFGLNDWTQVTRTTDHTISGITQPYIYAYVNYVHWNGTSYEYSTQQYYEIESDLGNEFCKITY